MKRETTAQRFSGAMLATAALRRSCTGQFAQRLSGTMLATAALRRSCTGQFAQRFGGAMLATAALLLSACAQPPPPDINDVCKIFAERSGWYKAAQQAEKKWKIPTAMIMAFIHQESSFVANTRPPRKKLMGFIPWTRPSTAVGYAQITDPAWADYKKETDYVFPRRTRFKYAADFIGWYNNKTAKQLGIPRNDAYNMYLAYHEGRGGYAKGRYKNKPKLKKTAERVARLAYTYDQQIEECREDLQTRWYSNLLNW